MYFTIEWASGGYRVRIYGGNHEQMFLSEVYPYKSTALHAINVVKAGALTAPVYDRTT
jgi:uncharacterized protein YegP (UPF0339 family)